MRNITLVGANRSDPANNEQTIYIYIYTSILHTFLHTLKSASKLVVALIYVMQTGRRWRFSKTTHKSHGSPSIHYHHHCRQHTTITPRLVVGLSGPLYRPNNRHSVSASASFGVLLSGVFCFLIHLYRLI